MASLSGGGDGRGGPRVAVLGATGCVGRAVCAALARSGYGVLAVARSFRPAVAGHPFVALDVAAAHPEELSDLLERYGVTAVVNATGGWGTTREEMEYAHVLLVERLLRAVALMARRPRLVHMGSIHEYGPVPFGTAIHEGVVPRPATAYARTKLAGSTAVLEAARAGEADAVVLRAVNVCGPYTTPASFLGGVVERLRALPPGAVLTLSIAEARRDFVDVRDLAEATVLAVPAPVAGRVVNIGRGVAVGMRELVALLVAEAGLPPGTVRDEGGSVDSKGGGWTLADTRLAAELLGWRARTGLAGSLRAMWDARETAPGTGPTITQDEESPWPTS
ncbi:NAD-dependent epimerase/dehydratase family protein [Streptomyces sp. NPDC001678]|uniref:NAD-dependent epimerase/dehydratase family protein n=1 Tax=Streptomyces sp. NPDC001678 TaxID=3364599 RepID=UPI0036C58CDA